MATSSFMRNAFISTLAVAGAMTAANDAGAQTVQPQFNAQGCRTSVLASNEVLESNRCYQRNVFEEFRQRAQQFVLVTSVRPIPEYPPNFFTSNPSRTLGFAVEREDFGDTNIHNDNFHVNVKYTDIRLNDNIDGPTPEWALIGSNSAHNQWLENQRATTDERVLLGATVLRPVNGQDMRGGFMMVTRGTATESTIINTGAISISFNNGEINPTAGLINVMPVKENYDAFLATSRQVAALN